MGVMVVEYCVKDNKYYRTTNKEVAHISMEEKGGGEGFLKGAYKAENVARKVEADWDKVYLARTEGSQEKGSISWKISLEDNLVKSRSIESDSGSSADDLSGEAKIFKDLVVDVGESSAEWSLLLLVSGLSSGLGKDSSLGENDDVLARELLLEFSDDLLVDLLPGLDPWEGDEKDDGLSAGSNLEFLAH